jgi:hypothetical protein
MRSRPGFVAYTRGRISEDRRRHFSGDLKDWSLSIPTAVPQLRLSRLGLGSKPVLHSLLYRR